MARKKKYLSILMRFADKLNKTGIVKYYVYFRIGHANYFAFFIGLLNFLTLQYFLLVRNIPILRDIFPNFWIFSLAFLTVYIPTSILLGWLDLKKLATKKVQQVGPFVKKPMYKEYLGALNITAAYQFLLISRLLLESAKIDESKKEKIMRILRLAAMNTMRYLNGADVDSLSRSEEVCEVLKDLDLIDERGYKECLEALRKSYYKVWEKEI